MPPRTDARAQLEVLSKDTADVVPAEELYEKLARSLSEATPLRAKLGIDPSRPDLHLGHTVVLRKLRQFQDLGHTAVLIIGDFTGRVGDPSGQSETRPFLTEDEIEENARTYLDQAGRVLDVERAEIRRNSEWLAKMDMGDVLRLTSSYTVARMLERDDFQIRQAEGRPISVVEFLYPLMQAMDSVATRTDVELGGTDQTFNLLVGRDIQRAYGQEPQVVMTMPLLPGTDGVRKMSKSFDNWIALTDPADEMFGKLMSIPDELTEAYLSLCAGGGAGSELPDHPNAKKRAMARAVVDLYHGEGAGERAEERFDLVHRQHELPDDIEEVPLPPSLGGAGAIWLPRLLTELGMAGSNSEARRLIEGGGVRLDGEPLTEPGVEIPADALRGKVVQVGRRRFVRIAPDG